MPSRLRIARNILANWSGLTASTLVSFLLAPYILHKLGDAGYGVWMLALSLTGYLGLLDLGIRSSVIRFVSSHRAKSEYGSLNQIFNTALLTFSSIGLLAFLIGVAIALSADKLFNIPPELTGQAQGVIILISAMLALNFVSGVFSSILAAAERFDLVNFNTLTSSLFRAGLILLIFPFKADLVTLGAVTLVSSLFYLLNIYFAFRHEPNLKLDFKLADRQTLRKIFNYSAFSFIIIISSRVAYYSDNTVIGIFGTAEMITYFAIGGIIVEFLRRFVNAFSTVIMPVASVLDSQEQNASLERLLLAGTKYSLLAILPLSLILASMGKTLLSVWMGPVYAEKSYIILLILLLPQIYNLSQFAAEEILLGISRHKFFSIIALTEALSNLV
ncbi:MAG: oligosaccharide flippase family protein, partial [candidate division Zixibacteria bacterium]|nr:oligosaccharide flippase family protein [candidate division Zixibacteria bacterium]